MMGMFCCWNCFFSLAEEDLVCKDGAFEFQRGWFFHPVGGFKEVFVITIIIIFIINNVNINIIINTFITFTISSRG